jgi:hypothetical protein
MIRKVMIALAAAALVTAGSTLTASAHGGGGGHGGGMGGHMGGFSHPGMAGNRFDHGRFANHRFFRHRFGNRFFIGGFPYWYYGDGCYTRVWTRWGWRWQYACY